MIKGMHGMMYTTGAEATRAFFRDVIGFRGVDTGEGWLIFDMPEADLGFHPGDAPGFDLSFYTDDLEATVSELKAKGVRFKSPVENQGYGLVTRFEAPGGLENSALPARLTGSKAYTRRALPCPAGGLQGIDG